MKKKIVVGILVIVAVVSVISAAVASKNRATRTHTTDRVKLALHSLVPLAEMYHYNNQTYEGFCESEEVNNFKELAEEHLSKVLYCYESSNMYELKVKIGSPYNSEWCIDQTKDFGECSESEDS